MVLVFVFVAREWASHPADHITTERKTAQDGNQNNKASGF
jgi:hypothetical protein